MLVIPGVEAYGPSRSTNGPGWMTQLKPYVGQGWGQPLYDCPGFPLFVGHIVGDNTYNNQSTVGGYAYNSDGTQWGYGKYGLGPMPVRN